MVTDNKSIKLLNALLIILAVISLVKFIFTALPHQQVHKNIAYVGKNVVIDFGRAHLEAEMGNESNDSFLLLSGLGSETQAAEGMFLTHTGEQARMVKDASERYGQCDMLTIQARNNSFTRLVMFSSNPDAAQKIKGVVAQLDKEPVIALQGRRLSVTNHTFDHKVRRSPDIPEIIYLVDDITIIKYAADRK
jgi:hypothetical protein